MLNPLHQYLSAASNRVFDVGEGIHTRAEHWQFPIAIHIFHADAVSVVACCTASLAAIRKHLIDTTIKTRICTTSRTRIKHMHQANFESVSRADQFDVHTCVNA